MQANIREKLWENGRKNHNGVRTKNSYSWEYLFDEYYEEYKVLLLLSKTLLLLFLSIFPFFPCLPGLKKKNKGQLDYMHADVITSLEHECAKAAAERKRVGQGCALQM